MSIFKHLKEPTKTIARQFGLNISLINKNEYTPWINDENFNSIYNKIKLNTLCTYHRCYELWQLVKESKKLSGSIIEIGVWKGGSGALIAQQAKKIYPNISNFIFIK